MSIAASGIALARNVGLRGVHAYLRAHGWIRDESGLRDTADVYVWPEDGREAAIVPASEEYPDYGTRIYQIASQLGRIEEREMLAVLTDLSLAEWDLVRIRLPNAEQQNTVKLTDWAAALEGAKGLLLAAACSVNRPQRMYRAGQIKQAADYLGKVRLGQAEPGSFVIKLLSPVPLAEEPFERRVVRRLVSGLRASRTTADRVHRNVADIREFEERVDEGISGNLCGVVATLTEVGRGLEVSVRWALTRPAASEASARVAVPFGPSDVGVLREAARVLAGRRDRTAESTSIAGVVGWRTRA